MKICSRDGNLLTLGFWVGVAVISLINIALINAGHNQLAYDRFILCISVIVIFVIAILMYRRSVQEDPGTDH
jgi:high-affinity Fe2+/Pb2+ permease